MKSVLFMGIKNTKIKGRLKLRGKPENQARAEIMVMRAQEKYNSRKRRRMLFTLLDFIIIVSLTLAVYSFYQGEILNGIFLLFVGAVPLAYFILRRILRKKSKK